MRKPLERYRVVVAYHIYDLAEAVNQLASEGWEPIGGIASQGDQYAQALWNKEPERVDDL